MSKRTTHIIAVANNKGGTGKTTTALALAYGFAREGLSVLAIDMEGQANFTEAVNVYDADAWSIEHFLLDKTFEPVRSLGFDVIPSTKDGMVRTFKRIGQDSIAPSSWLAEAIEPIKDRYDVIIIDTPPEVNLALSNSLMAATDVIIAVKPEIFSASGLTNLLPAVESIQRRGNPDLSVLGILVTQINTGANEHRLVADLIRAVSSECEVPVFDTAIRTSTYIGRNQRKHKSLFHGMSRNVAAQDYAALIEALCKMLHLKD